MPEAKTKQPRPFWSGTITFGLINLPVTLFVANRSNRIPLRMVDDSGTPLSRRYFCPQHEQTLTAKEIVRGYEVDNERFVVVEDDELDALAPEKSHDIDLRRFVPLTEIDPIYFNRTYLLAPEEDAIKAYQLLARSMDDGQRAGIATFVMRGTEHLVAIISEKGVLRAETLRFHEELRSPKDIGLPAIKQGDKARVRQITKCMRSRARKTLNRKRLSDHHSDAVRERIDNKLKAGEDVVTLPDATKEDEAQDNDNVVDLMQVLKDSLRQKKEPDRSKNRSDTQSKSKPKKDTDTGKSRTSLKGLPKTQLYELARKLGISGRSRMTKAELVDAINKQG